MLTIAISVIIGFLLGGASWVVARMLTAETREAHGGPSAFHSCSRVCAAPRCSRSPPLPFRWRCRRPWRLVAMLAVPLLVTLLTDLRSRLVFPVVLMPGLLAALGIAATRPEGVLPALICGGVAAAVTALLVVLARWIWSSEEVPSAAGISSSPRRSARRWVRMPRRGCY